MPSDPVGPPQNGPAYPAGAAQSRADARKAATTLDRAGHIAEAEAAYRRILDTDPRDPASLHLLALLLLKTRRPQEATELTRRAIELRPSASLFALQGTAALAAGDPAGASQSFAQALLLEPENAQAHLGLGNLRRVGGERQAALDHYRKAAAADPTLVEAEINIGVLLASMGRAEEAMPHLERARALRADDPDILANLGFAAGQYDPKAAIVWLQRALALKPDHAKALGNLAIIYAGLEQAEEAADFFRRALALRPRDTRLKLQLARQLAMLNQIEEAWTLAEQVSNENPMLVEGHLGLARLARIQGRFEEAQKYYRRAWELDPDSPAALAGLSGADDSPLSAADFAKMDELAGQETVPLRERRRLHFALAAQAERRQDYDSAFAHFARGNELRRAEMAQWGHSFDADAAFALVERIVESFDIGHFRRCAGMGRGSDLPVFIVGMPRSGTTLCEQILASHSCVHGAGELPEIPRLIDRLPETIGGGAVNPAPYPECVAALSGELAQRLANEHLARLQALAPEAARITDKVPTNFRHLGLIATLFPKARIIHCRRDPLDTCWSIFARNFDRSYAWAWDLDSIARFYRLYERLMEHWRRVLPVEMLEIRYEDVVADVERRSREIVAFCGLEWEDRCLRFYETDRPVRTASIEQVRRPIYAHSIGRWRRYESHLARLREALEVGA